jgi:NADPH-dependent curcumin reductase CurA
MPDNPPENRQVLLAARPHAMVDDSCFRMASEPAPAIADGEALVRVIYLSIDPTIRGWMAADTYLPAIRIGDVVRSGGLGEVVESKTDRYRGGDLVFGMTGWQEYAVADSGERSMTVLPPGIPLLDALSVYGITGMTAYFGVLDVGRPQAGETVVVSGAAGATGSVAGQIAKIKGCRVVGIAGSDEKCAWVANKLGFDACINYRTEDVPARLRETCPDGVDMFFDNVGGEILDAVLAIINLRARVVLCGAISTYNTDALPVGPSNYRNLIVQRGRMEGFIILDYLDRFPEAQLEMAGWVVDGKIQHAEDVVDGLEHAPDALNRLFTGANTGKVVVKVSEEP